MTTGASFRALGVCEAVTTMGLRLTESRIVVCAYTPIAGTANAMPAKTDFLKRTFTTAYFLFPVKDVSMTMGMLPYFNENVTTAVFSLNMMVMSLMVYAFSAPWALATVPA